MMKAGNIIPLAILGFLAFTLLKKANAANNFTFVFKGVNFKKFPQLEMILGIRNPSGDQFNVESLTGNILVNGKKFGDVNSFQKIIIQPNNETLLRVAVNPSLINIGTGIAEMIQQKMKGLRVNLNGIVNVSGGSYPIKYKLYPMTADPGRSMLLQQLPAFQGREELIAKNQGVYDIMKEIGTSHQLFAADYERIAKFFDTGETVTTCNKIFKYCKANIAYKVESEYKQSTRSPAAIISMASGDCKHYSQLIAGILDAITRTTGRRIAWEYRYSSYKILDPIPHHVFVVVKLDENEIWIDPVLKVFNEKKLYTHAVSKKVNTMPLVRMSGTGSGNSFGRITLAEQYKIAADKVRAGTMVPGAGVDAAPPPVEKKKISCRKPFPL